MFNRLFSWTTWLRWYQKDKPLWILMQQEKRGQAASAAPYANYLYTAPDR